MIYRAKIYWKYEDGDIEYYFNVDYPCKKFAIKGIFDYFINELLMETFCYGDHELSEEIKKREFDNLKKDYGEFFEVIDECNYKYVMDFFEMWKDRDKKHENGYSLLGFNKLVYDTYDQFCTDEIGIFYEIEEFERYKFLE